MVKQETASLILEKDLASCHKRIHSDINFSNFSFNLKSSQLTEFGEIGNKIISAFYYVNDRNKNNNLFSNKHSKLVAPCKDDDDIIDDN